GKPSPGRKCEPLTVKWGRQALRRRTADQATCNQKPESDGPSNITCRSLPTTQLPRRSCKPTLAAVAGQLAGGACAQHQVKVVGVSEQLEHVLAHEGAIRLGEDDLLALSLAQSAMQGIA